jgi:hypothetical protein
MESWKYLLLEALEAILTGHSMVGGSLVLSIGMGGYYGALHDRWSVLILFTLGGLPFGWLQILALAPILCLSYASVHLLPVCYADEQYLLTYHTFCCLPHGGDTILYVLVSLPCTFLRSFLSMPLLQWVLCLLSSYTYILLDAFDIGGCLFSNGSLLSRRKAASCWEAGIPFLRAIS